jgi:beta-galactosidase beta subunit
MDTHATVMDTQVLLMGSHAIDVATNVNAKTHWEYTLEANLKCLFGCFSICNVKQIQNNDE